MRKSPEAVACSGRSSGSRDVEEYWESRARRHAGDPKATTHDIHLRRLEARTIFAAVCSLDLGTGARVLDIGCGDGASLLEWVSEVPRVRVTGIDNSPTMIANARARLATLPALADRVTFQVGDALALESVVDARTYDLAVTDRCLINLRSEQQQAAAIRAIAACLRAGGTYLAIENFVEGQDSLNDARAAVGLPPIPVRWHNIYFTEPRFREAVQPYFDLVQFNEFCSSYYLVTRVLYSRMCKIEGVEPDYDHLIHRVAVELPSSGGFSPIRLAILRRRRA